MSDFRGDTSGVSTLRAALTVVLVGIVATGIGLTFVWDDRGSPREVTTTGTLTGSHPSARHEKRKGTWYEFQYTIADGRQVATSFRVTPSGSLGRDGDRVKVIYSPDAPMEGRLWVTRGGLEFLPAAGGLALTLGALRVVISELLKRRRRRQAPTRA
ncbi:DUF3592 domain-containing protein [Micromonospora sp. NPDC049230]|uniref:DUF3592 domain-containing protein n=1 Tax=Micromonospora sp. NPDC049230 TaxID=3155502 RepID=UPI0033D2DF4B